MKKLRTILEKIQALNSSGDPCALATVVNVRGSAYRRPGARMLFSMKGREAGFVSAACLESDIFEKAQEAIVSGEPTLVSYDTTAPEDAIFGIGQGCGGFVEIFIEPFLPLQANTSITLLSTASSQVQPCALATVIRSNNNSVRCGTKMLHLINGEIVSRLSNGELGELISRDTAQALKDRKTFTKHYDVSSSSVDVCIEILTPPAPFFIFGATPDVKPLVRFAAALGWNVTVIDHRSAYAQQKDFPEADAVLLLSPETYAERLLLPADSFAVIMIHQFEAEAEALQFLFDSPVRYIGLLGPKSKRNLLLQRLSERNFIPSDQQLTKLHNPVGLDIGAETAEEIAISIVAEIQSVIKGRKPAFLKDRQGAIH